MEKFDPEEIGKGIKSNYTQDENYRAYKLFSMMDVDGGGSISLRELNRILMGEVIRFVSCDFDHPDTGIVYGLDEENCAAIIEIEAMSSASQFPFLIERMRLHKINDLVIKQHDRKSLDTVYKELLRIHDEPLTLTFHEPVLIINKFSCAIDIEIEGDIYYVSLPIGAIYSAETFCKKVEGALAATDPLLEEIKVQFDAKKRQVTFFSRTLPFKLLFASGANCKRSCRYAFGFSAEDTALSNIHVGQPMLMNLNLGISQAKMEILMTELFQQFDRDGSGEFEFEEFRDFYIKYLDSEESLDRLKKYAAYRFRDVEREKFVLQQQYERKLKAQRRRYLKEKNRDLLQRQRNKFFEDSLIDKYGNRRRRYRHRTHNGSLQQQPSHDSSVAFKSTIPFLRDDEAASDVSSIKETAELHQPSINRVEREAQLAARRDVMKEKQRLQADRRKRIIEKIIEANRELKRKERRQNAQHIDEIVATQLMELQFQIKRKLIGSMKMTNNTAFERINTLGVSVDKVITSPAVTVGEGVLSNSLIPPPDMLKVDILPASKVHPAMMNYYSLKENHYSAKEVFNAEYIHPAFFMADYIRAPSRHSFVALSLTRVLKAQRAIGVQYRADHNMKRCYALPSEDEIPMRQPPRPPPKSKKLMSSNQSVRALSASTKTVSFVESSLNRIRREKTATTLARMTVKSIRLRDLISVHPLQKNSPFLSLDCGAFKFVTEAYSFAGSRCEWVELNWVFRVFRSTTLKLAVSSGNPATPLPIGCLEIPSAVLLALEEDKDHIVTIDASLTPFQGSAETNCGQLTMKLFVEKGDEWDWFVQECQKQEKEEAHRRHQIHKFSRTLHGDHHPECLSFPFRIKLLELSVLDLQVSLWSRMNLTAAIHVVLQTNDVLLSTAAIKSSTAKPSLEEAVWQGLDWELDISSSDVKLIFSVFSSKTNLLGRVVVSGMDIMHMISNARKKFEVIGDIRDQAMDEELGAFKGKLLATGEVLMRPIVENLTESNVSPLYVHIPALFTVRELEISLQNLSSSLLKASITIKLTCEHRVYKHTITDPRKDGLHLSALQWDLPLRSRSLVTCSIEATASNQPIGSLTFRSDELLAVRKTLIQQSWDGRRADYSVELHRYCYNAQEMVGSVLMHAVVSHEDEPEVINRMIADDAPVVSPVLDVLPSNQGADSSNNSRGVVTSNLNNIIGTVDAGTLITEINPEKVTFPVRITIIEIILTDVRKAHFLRKNSLEVSIIAGPLAANAPAKKNVGQHCHWSGLDLSLVVHQGNSLRVCVKSLGVIIGETSFANNALIESRPDKAGIRELFTAFGSSEHPYGGKIRLSFYLDNVQAATVPATSISHFKGADLTNILAPSALSNQVHNDSMLYPHLLVVYHIAFMGLPTVHFFAKNSPYLKLRYWVPRRGPIDLSTPTLVDAGNFGKWMNLVWEIILSAEDDAILVQVISDSIMIGETVVRARQFFQSIPNQYGVRQVDFPIYQFGEEEEGRNNAIKEFGDKNNLGSLSSLQAVSSGSFLAGASGLMGVGNNSVISTAPQEARGMLRFVYTTEPHVLEEDVLDLNGSLEFNEEDEVAAGRPATATTTATASIEQRALTPNHAEPSLVEDGSVEEKDSTITSASTYTLIQRPPSMGDSADYHSVDSSPSYLQHLQTIAHGEVWRVEVSHLLFVLFGSSRVKRFLAESMIQVQVVCGDYTASVKVGTFLSLIHHCFSSELTHDTIVERGTVATIPQFQSQPHVSYGADDEIASPIL